MGFLKFFLFLTALAICDAYAYKATVQMTYVESVSEFHALNPGVELIKMKTFVDEVKQTRSYSVGARQSGEL